jgi:tetratricopeptide (TPR) repeat protein
VAAQCGHVPAQRGATLNLIKIYADRGDIEPALKLLAQGEALAPGFEHTRAELAFLQVRYFLHYQQGDVPAARAAATRLLDVADRTGEPEAIIGSSHLVADLFFLIGDLAQAQAMLDKAQQAALAADKGGGHLYPQPWSPNAPC